MEVNRSARKEHINTSYISQMLRNTTLALAALTIPYFSVPCVAQTQSFKSNNWAGYVAATDFMKPEASITEASCSWTVPKASKNGSYTRVFVGVGGAIGKDKSLLQIGTVSSRSSNVEKYETFYETLPYASQKIPLMTLSAGDHVKAEIRIDKDDPNKTVMELTINGERTGRVTKLPYGSSGLSADCVVEPVYFPYGNNKRKERISSVFENVHIDNFTAVIDGEEKPANKLQLRMAAVTDPLGYLMYSPQPIGKGGTFDVQQVTDTTMAARLMRVVDH